MASSSGPQNLGQFLGAGKKIWLITNAEKLGTHVVQIVDSDDPRGILVYQRRTDEYQFFAWSYIRTIKPISDEDYEKRTQPLNNTVVEIDASSY